jgi:hypothetical protein
VDDPEDHHLNRTTIAKNTIGKVASLAEPLKWISPFEESRIKNEVSPE